MDNERCEFCGEVMTFRSMYRRNICHRLPCANSALVEAMAEEVIKRASAEYLLAHGSDWLRHCQEWQKKAQDMADRGER